MNIVQLEQGLSTLIQVLVQRILHIKNNSLRLTGHAFESPSFDVGSAFSVLRSTFTDTCFIPFLHLNIEDVVDNDIIRGSVFDSYRCALIGRSFVN